MADIAARSFALVDDYGAGYRPVGTPASPRYTVTKTIKDNGNATATITLTVTIKTHSGYVGGGYTLTLNFSCAGVSTSSVWKASAGSWSQNSTYSKSIAVTIPLDGVTTKTADLWLTINSGTYFTFRSSTQGGNQITGIPVGYTASTFNSFGAFTTSTAAINIPCSVTRNTSSLTNRLTLTVAGVQIFQKTGLGTFTTVALTAAESTKINNALPNNASATATMKLDTMNGSTQIATSSRTATVTVNTSLVPTFTSLTASETITAVANLLGAGVYAKNLSRPRFTITGSAAKGGATLKTYSVTFNGQTLTGNVSTSATNTSAAAILNWSGSAKSASCVIYDSRGRKSAAKTVSITPLDYTTPNLSTATIYRASNTSGTASENGVYLSVTRVMSIASLGNKNQMTLTIQHKLTTSSTWTTSYTNTWATGTNSGNGTTTVTNYTFPATNSYDVRVTVSDKLGNSSTKEGGISSASYPLIWGKDNVGISAVPLSGYALTVGGKLYVDGAIRVSGGFDSPVTADLNTEYISGQYYYTNTTVGRPSPYGYVDVTVSAGSTYNGTSNWIWQTAYSTDGRIYQRNRINAGSWTSWKEILTDGSSPILTSTSGGTARCVRWPNGWQEITWRRTLTTTVQLPVNQMYYSASTLPETAWPWAFSETPTVTIDSSGASQLAWAILHGTCTSTGCGAIYMMKSGSDSVTRNYTINIMAKGRWK